MGKHEEYQNRYRKMYGAAVGLGENATVKEIVSGLVKIKQVMEATEFLFGAERSAPINQDQLGFQIFMRLMTDRDTELLLEVASNHCWSSSRGNHGFAIQVYPGEWFVIKEPTATKMLRRFM